MDYVPPEFDYDTILADVRHFRNSLICAFHTVNHAFPCLTQIDVSKYNFPKEIWYRIPDQEWIAKVVSFVPVILFGLIGNALLITIILRNKNLRTPTNLLIANMATADFATLLICPIMVMYRDFFQNYLLGPVGCKSEGFMQASLLITAVLSLCAVSYDRLTAIVLPQETRLTMKGAKLVILATWLLGAGFSVPLIIFRNYRVGTLCVALLIADPGTISQSIIMFIGRDKGVNEHPANRHSSSTGTPVEELSRVLLQREHLRAAHVLARAHLGHCLVPLGRDGHLLFGDFPEIGPL